MKAREAPNTTVGLGITCLMKLIDKVVKRELLLRNKRRVWKICLKALNREMKKKKDRPHRQVNSKNLRDGQEPQNRGNL